MNTTNAIFSRDQLWYLRSRIRHEMADQEKWEAPPADVDLNRQIAAAILLCESTKTEDAWLELNKQDCLLIDYVTDQDATDANGLPLGRAILLASFAAYERLANPYPDAEDPDEAMKVVRLEDYRKLVE